MYTKLCKGCNLILDIISFNKHLATKDGYRNKCKECRRLEHIEYRIKNQDKFILYEKLRNLNGASKNRDKAKRNANHAKRRATKLNATPNWLTKNELAEITEYYIIAKMFQLYTGNEYHVDHIIPLQGKLVCGLHVPWNLQVIPAKDNLSKNNKY